MSFGLSHPLQSCANHRDSNYCLYHGVSGQELLPIDLDIPSVLLRVFRLLMRNVPSLIHLEIAYLRCQHGTVATMCMPPELDWMLAHAAVHASIVGQPSNPVDNLDVVFPMHNAINPIFVMIQIAALEPK